MSWTEHWVSNRLFCPSCGAERMTQFAGNRPVADFYCSICREEYRSSRARSIALAESIADEQPSAPCANV